MAISHAAPRPLFLAWPRWSHHSRAGADEIVSILDGRAVLECWRGASGLEGVSLFWAADGPGAVCFEGVVEQPDGLTFGIAPQPCHWSLGLR